MAAGRFYVTRPDEKKDGYVTGEWLKGTVSRADAEEEALALLADRRDTVTAVYFWDLRWNQFGPMWTEKDRRVKRLLKERRAA